MRALKTILITTTAATLLSSCMVGPDFKRPAEPDVKRFTDTDLPDATASSDSKTGAAQRFATARDLPKDWWKLFGSDPLNKLVDKAVAANPDLKAASSALREAKENYMATRGELFPTVDGSLTDTREKFNPSSFGEIGVPPSLFTLYYASVSVSYGIDLFGGTRREMESAQAQEDYARYEAEAAYLTVTANVVTAAITEAGLREQIKETQDIDAIETKALDVLKKQFEFGASAKSTVLEQEATVAATEATLPPLEKQLAQTRNQLAVLIGVLPGNAQLDSFSLDGLHLPEEIPVSLPSKLVEQRPDIKEAEAELHSASAEIGVATANMLPQLSLTGSYGSQATKTNNLFTGPAEVWSIGAGLTQPIFQGGTLLHKRRESVAAFEKARAQYQSTVLTAFKNVADSLRALQYDAEALKAETYAQAAAKNSLDLAQAQYKDGAISYPQLLDTERSYSQARIGYVQAEALRLADTAALFQALGGGLHPQSPVVATPAPATAAPAQVSPAAAPTPGGNASPSTPTPATIETKP